MISHMAPAARLRRGSISQRFGFRIMARRVMAPR
jgi:hypothetical protein